MHTYVRPYRYIIEALFIPTVLQIVIILGSSLISSFGYFRIIRTSFFIKIFTGLWLLCMGQQAWAVMVFFFVERFVETVMQRLTDWNNIWYQNRQLNDSFLGSMSDLSADILLYINLVRLAYLCPGSVPDQGCAGPVAYYYPRGPFAADIQHLPLQRVQENQ